uniref:Uncharacterized protein n=1 Tax=Heliothis virescens TaxID=7102 RepID=A0A2A4K308_HELVI
MFHYANIISVPIMPVIETPGGIKRLRDEWSKEQSARSSSALASKGLEFSNWKKRSSYDRMKGCPGRQEKKADWPTRQDCNRDDLVA